MSYILDALKKADAERDQGAVPGLHSRHELPKDQDEDEPRRLSPMLWVGAGVAATLVLVLAWQWWQRPAPFDGGPGGPRVGGGMGPGGGPGGDAMMAEGQMGVGQMGVGPAGMARPMDRSQNDQMGHRPGPGAVSGRLTEEGPRRGSQAPSRQPPRSQAQVQVQAQAPQAEPPAPRAVDTPRSAAPQAPVAAPTPAPVTTAPKAPPAIQAAPAPQPAVPDVHALPESLRRELPNLTIGGAMYSDTRTNRMLVLNNQVFHEGDQPAPGLVLEEIRLKSAVFNYRGTRYSVNY